jgi:hypothetical protein
MLAVVWLRPVSVSAVWLIFALISSRVLEKMAIAGAVKVAILSAGAVTVGKRVGN